LPILSPFGVEAALLALGKLEGPKICPAEVGACSRAAYAQIPLFSGIKLGSPMETLISDERYFGSPRALLDFASAWADNSLFQEWALQDSACYAAFVAPELARR